MKIVLLSDNTMNVNDKGAPQTLYNIFSFILPENILCITSKKSYKNNPPSFPFSSRYLTYNLSFISLPSNRFTNKLKKIEQQFNYTLTYYFRSFKRIKKQIQAFNAAVFVLCLTDAESVFMYVKLRPVFTGKIFPYLMDDWMIHNTTKWPGSNIYKGLKEILINHRSWLMISKNLSDILCERYSTKPEKLLEIHNPVEFADGTILPYCLLKDEFIIVYAGSLWPMHFDALLAFCKAINILQSNQKVKLIIYTAESHWKWRKRELNFTGVYYGGNIPYQQIHAKLSEADCLLITSSFSKDWFTHSRGSVQTKITDYMSAARLIVGCGPPYSANHEFIKKYKCGICIETNDPKTIAEEFDKILNKMPSNMHFINNGVEALKNHFSFSKVHQKLKDFLSA